MRTWNIQKATNFVCIRTFEQSREFNGSIADNLRQNDGGQIGLDVDNQHKRRVSAQIDN